MTDAIAAALAANLNAPEIELQAWEAVPRAERDSLANAILSSHSPRYLVAPETQASLAATIATANAEGLWTLIYGCGTKLNWGGTLKEIDLLVSTRHLNRIIEFAVGDLTITVEAGTTLATVQQRLAAHQQFLPIDPAFPDTATIGGILATADTGSWRHRYGGIRDLVLGVSMIRADGQFAKAGGRVVKNVAGYDLMKLLVGSYGTLGTIAEVTLRTYALAEASQTLLAIGPPAAIAAAARQLRDSPLTPVAADLVTASALPESGQFDPHHLGAVIRFQGSAAGVEAQVARCKMLASNHSLKVVGPYCNREEAALWEWVRAIARAPRAGATCKIGLKPAAATDLLGNLPEAAAGIVHLGSGLGRLAVAAEAESLGSLRAFCESHGGFLTLLSASKDFKTRYNIEPWGYTGNALEIMRRLKRRFDPNNILSPGRFVGNL